MEHTLQYLDDLRNKALDKCILIINLVLTVSYVVEYIKGNRTLGYIFSFFGVIWIPFCISHLLLYKKNRTEEERHAYKYVVILFYILFYSYSVYSSYIDTTWCYIFPLVSIVMIFSNYKCIILSLAPAIVVNITNYIFQFGYLDNETTVAFEQKIACLILCVVFMSTGCVVLNKYYNVFIKLFNDANIDDTTGLYNFSSAKNIIVNSMSDGKELRTSLILITIDNFDSYSNKYGHVFADKVLKTVSNVLSNILEEYSDNSIVTKFPNDEFGVFINNRSRDELSDLTSEILDRMKNVILSYRGNEVILSTTLGVTDTDTCSNYDFTELYNRARDLIEGEEDKSKKVVVDVKSK